MTLKTYIAKTPLILQNEAGEDYRVEANKTVSLTPEQYQDVAAHVFPAETQEEEAEQAAQQEGEEPSETPDAEQEEAKPARGRKAKAE